MKIAKRLYRNFGIVVAFVVVAFVVNILIVRHEHTSRNLTMKTENIRQQLLENRLALSNYLLSGSPDDAEKLTSGMSKLQQLIRVTQQDSGAESVSGPIGKLASIEAEWEKFATSMTKKRKMVDAGESTVSELQVEYLNGKPVEWLAQSTQLIDQVEADRLKSDDIASGVTTYGTFLGMILVAIGVGIIAVRTAKSITEPLDQLIFVTREIGESGDLEHTIEIDRTDEIGELARSFAKMVAYLKEMAAISEAIAGGDLSNEIEPRSKRDILGHAFVRMTEGLQALVRSVRDAAAQVASGSNQVANASDETAKVSVQASSAIDEVTSTMHEMSINVQNMVKSTQVQASSVSETSASIDEMVASIQRVADTAKVLLDISNRSRQEVQNGITSMEKANAGLNRITESIQSSGEIITVLGQRADDIGKIIEVIDDISEQTNLLALNAAIEAARAGEHGLGFAVVADEVRKLAEKSAQSTKEISELIQSIQKEARNAVEKMDKSTTMVNEGMALGAEVSSAVKKISNVVTEVYKFAQEIGAATNEQSHGSSQIAKATTRLNEITHEINSSVEEQASGTQAVVRAMERMRELVQQSTSSSTELAASSEQMSKMSRSLLEVMDRFRLDFSTGSIGSQASSSRSARAAAGRA